METGSGIGSPKLRRCRRKVAARHHVKYGNTSDKPFALAMSSHLKHAALCRATILDAKSDDIVSCPHVSEEAHRPADT